MPTPNPLLLIAELTYRCPLHCPYCSNPLNIGEGRYGEELSTEDWQRVFREGAALGVLQLALTGGEPMARRDIVELARHVDGEPPLQHARDLGAAVPAQARGGPQGGGSRPRPDQHPGQRARVERRDRRDGLLRAQARGRRPDAGARLPAHDQRRAASAQPRPDRGRSSRLPRSLGRGGSSWPTPSITAGRRSTGPR